MALLLALAGAGCHVHATPLERPDLGVLERLERAPESVGDLVYRGTVFRLDGAATDAPLFHYQRRVRQTGGLQVSTHLTRGPDGDTMLSLAATHTSDYGFVELEQINAQNGVTGRVRVLDDGRIAFETERAGRVTTRVESVDAPIVVGPTLFGWVRAHWATLVAGEPLEVRFATVDRARSYSFVLRLQQSSPSTTVISMSAKSALVRAGIAPMRLVFDTASGKIVRYEGRVPPMLEDAHGLSPLDARVEYAFVAPTYR